MNKKIFNFQFSIFNSSSKGFTLVELIISVALFTLVAFISIGAILTIFDANKRARSSKTVVDNLNFAIEDMARTVRFGEKYYCDSNPNGPGFLSYFATNCSFGGRRIVVDFNDSIIVYRWRGGINDPIEKSNDGGFTYTSITAPETKIEYLNFYVLGAEELNKQPSILIVIKGYSGNKSTIQSKFSIETLMSQRDLDT